MKVGILADDLTSATDGTAPFVNLGHRCTVLTDHVVAPLDGNASVVSINMASRPQNPQEAARRSAAAASALATADILYKTVDSTIRGNLAAEISAALEGSGRKFVVLAPAFPGAGRTTQNGRQLLNGVPLEDTVFGRDPGHPVKNSLIRSLFAELADSEVRTVDVAEIRATRPSGLDLQGYKLLIVDAIEQSDLRLLVEAVANPSEVLWCGSPGMAIALSEHLGPVRAGNHGATINLFVVGSVNPLNVEQRRDLECARAVRTIVLDAEAACRSPFAAAEAVLSDLAIDSSGFTDLVLVTSQGSAADPALIAKSLGMAARKLVDGFPVRGLFLTGGDTAEAVLGALEVSTLTLLGEIEPGIPVGRARGAMPLHIITKAGGFGSRQVLVKSADVLRGLSLGEGE